MQKMISKGKTLAVLVGAVLCATTQAEEQSLDLALSNHVVAAGYGFEFRPDVSLTAGFLHSNSNDLSNNLFSAGFGVSGNLAPQVRPRIGAKVFLLNGEHVDGHGLAAEAGVTITAAPKLMLDFAAAFSPDIVTSGDIDNFYDVTAKVGYEIIPKGQVYVGYQDAQGGRKGPDYEIYQGILVGFKMTF
jgi:hypothetical protein